MFRTIAQRSALALALLFLTMPASRMQGQSAVVTSSVVTGGDPQPTGEPPPKPGAKVSMPIMVLTMLMAFGLA